MSQQFLNGTSAHNRPFHFLSRITLIILSNTHTHTHPFNGPFSGTTRVSQYQKGKTNLDFTEATDSEWHWHQLGHIQVCTSLQTDNHTNTSIFTARCYASMVLAMALCPSVTSRCSTRTAKCRIT